MPGKGTIAVVLVNGIALSALAVGVQVVTDNYIDERVRTTILYQSNQGHRFELQPNQVHYRANKQWFTIGAHGLRGEPPALPKPKDELRLFVIGGSSVFDHLQPAPSWPEALGTALQSRGVSKAKGYNAGVPGYSSYESVAAYDAKVRPFKPDVVLIYQGWNDAKYMQPMADAQPVDEIFPRRDWKQRYQFLQGPWPTRNLLTLQRIWADFNQSGDLRETKPVELKPAPTTRVAWRASPGLAFWKSNLESFVNKVRGDDAMPVLIPQVTLTTSESPAEFRKKLRYDWVGMNHESLVALNDAMVDVMLEVARTSSVAVIDLRSNFNGKAEYFADHVHLKPAGSAAFAEALATRLAPIIQQR